MMKLPYVDFTTIMMRDVSAITGTRMNATLIMSIVIGVEGKVMLLESAQDKNLIIAFLNVKLNKLG